MFSIFSAIEGSSQTKKENLFIVNYQVNYNTNKFIEKNAQLIFNNSQNNSYYFEFEDENLNTDKISVDEFGKTTETIIIDSKMMVKINFMDFNKKKIYSTETISFDDRLFKVNENLDQLKWNIRYNETNKIGNYLCNKATLNFRGRNYIAWYTDEIPISSGPWKFRGLPGLILEIYDETLKYEWIVTKITKENSSEVIVKNNVTDIIKNKDLVDISLKNYVILKDSLFYRKFKNVDKKIKSRQDRGVNSDVKINYNRLGKELKYEWEITKEN